jgi:hypothetical protein
VAGAEAEVLAGGLVWDGAELLAFALGIRLTQSQPKKKKSKYSKKKPKYSKRSWKKLRNGWKSLPRKNKETVEVQPRLFL